MRFSNNIILLVLRCYCFEPCSNLKFYKVSNYVNNKIEMRYHLLAIPDAKGTNMAAEKISPEKITALSETMLIPSCAMPKPYA